MDKVCVVTGASRGIGHHICKTLQAHGHTVYPTMRSPAEGGYRLDVTDPDSITTCITSILDKEGRIDVLINNAGYGLLSTVEMASDSQVQNLFDINVFGLIRTAQAVLPTMRAQKSGLILNISSLAGIRAGAAFGLYSATKFSLEAITDSLAESLAPWNIHAITLNPGYVKTEFADSVPTGERPLEGNPYQALIEESKANALKGLANGQDPDEVAQLVVELVEQENPPRLNPTSEAGRTLIQETLVQKLEF